MLDMGFDVQLNKIAEYLPADRQTLMFSATVPPAIERLSQKYLRSPQRIAIGSLVQPVLKIKQDLLHVRPAEKFPELCKQLEERQGAIIVFVKTRHGTERLCRELQKLGHSSDAIHGDLQQRRRESVIQGFRNQRTRILVATDVAARGLDIPHVMHVINYDLPQCPEDYIHRIGRTGRAGAEGNALCLVSPEDGHKWRAIARFMNPEEAKSAPHSKKPHFGPRKSFGFSNRGKKSSNSEKPFGFSNQERKGPDSEKKRFKKKLWIKRK